MNRTQWFVLSISLLLLAIYWGVLYTVYNCELINDFGSMMCLGRRFIIDKFSFFCFVFSIICFILGWLEPKKKV